MEICYSRNCLALTTRGRAGSEAASLSWPARSIWLAPLLTGNATVNKEKRHQRTAKHPHTLLWTHVHICVRATYPSSEDLVDGSALFQSALGHHFGSHLLHIQHESIQRFLDMRPLVLFFLGRNGGFPANTKHKKNMPFINCKWCRCAGQLEKTGEAVMKASFDAVKRLF